MVAIKVTIIALFVLIRCTQHGLAQTICTAANTCDDCLQSSPNCIWCNQTYFDQSARCFLMDDRGNCSDDNLITVPGTLKLLNNSNLGQNVLVSPQSVEIKLRLGEPQSFQIAVNRVRNAPLDLYFLVDQSVSMLESLDSFKTLIGELFDAIKADITNNSLVGMGLFVDKPIAPYISESRQTFENPCGGGVTCRSPYGFMHIMQLTDNIEEFQRILNEQVISGNLDDPEGGLDAILQAIVCKDIIGWRPDSLRLLMHISDAQIHVAGDGLLAGIVHPAVPECHLQPNGSSYFYNGTIIYDYPSLTMIQKLLSENSITLVFGVVIRNESDSEDTERNVFLRNFIQSVRNELPQSLVEPLLADSSDIIQAVENAYRAITTNITLEVNAPDGIDVTFVPGCPENDGRNCLNVDFDQVVKFNVTVTASSCDNVFIRDGSIFNINVPGFGNVEVDFEGICSCECSEMIEMGSSQCSGVGDLRCGSCICPIDRDGINCECDETNAATENCKNNSRNGELCSGPERGICQCGRCVCTNETFFGEACECDNISCERDNNGMICGGPGRGNCGCNGTCTCVNGWSGSACDCTPDQSNCLSSALICSNRGTCECNECICDSEDFTGQFCQICTALECPTEPACLAYGDCVVCQFGTQGSAGRTCDRICNITSLGETLQPGDPFDRGTYMIDGSTQTLACLTTQGDCTYRYFVGTSTSDQQPPIVFEGESCTEDSEFPAWIIIVIILGALLLLGILVLIGIKIFMELRYRYEYQQWLKEKESAKFGQQLNPLYTKATTDIDNPLYDQKKRQKQKEAEGATSAI